MSVQLSIYLRELRVFQGLSLNDAASQIGVGDKAVIEAWETGKETPSLNLCDRIAKTYEVSEDEIFEVLTIESLEPAKNKSLKFQ